MAATVGSSCAARERAERAMSSRAAANRANFSFLILSPLVIRRTGEHPTDQPVHLLPGQRARLVERHLAAGDVRIAAQLLDHVAAVRIARLDAVQRRALGGRPVDD